MDEPATTERHEVLACRLGDRGADEVAAVQLGQGADPVPAVLAIQASGYAGTSGSLVQERTSSIEVVAVVGGADAFEDRRRRGGHRAKRAVIEIHVRRRLPRGSCNSRGNSRRLSCNCSWERTKALVQFRRSQHQLEDLVDVACEARRGFSTDGFVDPARDAQARVDAPTAGCGDHLLTEFANEDRPLADLGEGFDHADNVALGDGASNQAGDRARQSGRS